MKPNIMRWSDGKGWDDVSPKAKEIILKEYYRLLESGEDPVICIEGDYVGIRVGGLFNLGNSKK